VTVYTSHHTYFKLKELCEVMNARTASND
jgi:hypothetical protein